MQKKIRQEQQKYVEEKLQEQQMQPEFYLSFRKSPDRDAFGLRCGHTHKPSATRAPDR